MLIIGKLGVGYKETLGFPGAQQVKRDPLAMQVMCAGDVGLIPG